MRTQSLRVAVVGAGMGGLTAAIALRRQGVDVAVFEQARALTEVGAGVALGANGSRLLRRLDLAAGLERVSVRPARTEFRHWRDGSLLCSHALGETYEQRFDAPFYTVHRAELQRVLVERYVSDGGTLHLGHRCVSMTEHRDEVEIAFSDGGVESFDVVMGADGIHSVVRQGVAGEDTAVYSGTCGYRALVASERLPFLPAPGDQPLWLFLGPGRHLVAFPVSGGRLVNFLAVVPEQEPGAESWTSQGEVAQAVKAFDGWDPMVTGLIGAAESVSRWALYDREPLRHWSTARTTLLGDAAHPMLPHHGQGANQAVEDAAVLASCLAQAEPGSPAEALRRYETLRRARTRQVQLASRANAACFHLADGPDADARDAALPALPDQLAWIHGYDADQSVPDPA